MFRLKAYAAGPIRNGATAFPAHANRDFKDGASGT
jgi:hypothetical protein